MFFVIMLHWYFLIVILHMSFLQDQMLEDIDIKEEQEEAKKQEEIAKNFVKLSLDEKNKVMI